MPKNAVSDLITDQEMAFARLVLSGTMSDRDAAQAVGLNPDSAAYIKSKPCVRAYMLEHRAAAQQQLAEQGTEAQRRNQRREQDLARLWELANMGPEKTRGSLTGQLKALSLIIAMEGLIPDRGAAASLPQRASTSPQRASTSPQRASTSPQRASQTQSTPGAGQPQIAASGSLARQPEKTIDPEPSPADMLRWLESLNDEDLGPYKM